MGEVKELTQLSSQISAVMTILGFITFLITWALKARKGYQKPFDNLNSKIDKLAEDVSTLNQSYEKRNETLAHFLRRRLVGNAEYYIAQKFITVKEKEDFIEDFTQYKALGFNHVVDSMLEDVKKLPVLTKAQE